MPSGRFVLRIEPGLHGRLRRQARSLGVSLNELCGQVLAHGSGIREGVSHNLLPALDRALSLLGDDLVAAALYGSAARGELAASSDIDLLVVVEPTRRIDRELYRRWDRGPLECDGRPVEPHFVLMAGDEHFTGLWGELAVDALVLFDPELRLHRRLSLIRKDMAEGRLVRRVAHGQPYWVWRDEVA